MITENYLKCLRAKNRVMYNVALRQALCYYLYKENIPCTIISQAMGCTRRYVYMAIYKVRDLLEIGDKMTKQATEEICNHTIKIVPVTVDGQLLSKHVGYRIILSIIIL